MSHAGWSEVYHRVLELYAGEPIETRIAIGLGLAFATLMVLEGLRAAFFFTGRRRAQTATLIAPRAATKPAGEKKSAAKAAAAPEKIRVRVFSPKVVKAEIKPFRSARPQIRHAGEVRPPRPMVTAEGASFSPLPPISGQKGL